MTETVVAKQVRLVLEQQCAQIFMRVLAHEHRERGYDCTLFMFDYGDGAEGNVAFKTSLSRDAFLDTIDRLLASGWARGEMRFVEPGEKVMGAERLVYLHHALKALCPAGVGYALLVGSGDAVQYISTGHRPGVAEMLRIVVSRRRAEGVS